MKTIITKLAILCCILLLGYAQSSYAILGEGLTGAAIGGIAGGRRGAAIGAGVGLGVGAMRAMSRDRGRYYDDDDYYESDTYHDRRGYVEPERRMPYDDYRR